MNKDIRDYMRLLGFVKPHLWVLIRASVCMLVYSILNSLSPIALIPIMDNIIGGKKLIINPHAAIPQFVLDIVDSINSIPAMKLMTIILTGALIYFFLRNLFEFLQTYLMNDVSQRVMRDVKDVLYKKMLSLSMRFYSQNPTAKLMSRITYDATIIRDAISTGLLDLILRPIEIICHIVVLISVTVYSGIPMKFLLTSAILFPCILLPAALVAKRLRQLSTRTQEKMGDINTVLFEIITGIRIVKAFSMQKYEYRKFRDQNKGFYKLELKAVKRLNVISPINEFTSALYMVMVMFIAGRQIIDGTLSSGALAFFIASVFLMIKPVKRLGKVYAIIQKALASAVRVFELLDTESEIKVNDNAISLPVLKDSISLEHVWFKYRNEDVIKDITIDIKKGDIIAIVGPSGAGKTSLVNLIPRFYDPIKGNIKIDGINIKDVSLKSLRDQIGMVTQEMFLFNDTVQNNISYGSKGYDLKDVVNASKVANAHDFIMKMPERYDTIIGERGFRISGGERQRISIARAIFKNPPILIFDEATSQLDTESERMVQEAIDRLMQGRTVFVIAHRLSTVTHANKIIVLENGRIVELGTHRVLLSKGGLYKRLYDMQFFERGSDEDA